jgi:regulator of cell morphogenesis and NO signaling
MNEQERLMNELQIDDRTTVSDMVRRDYRTASVFRKYDIEFCCGGKWPLQTVSVMKGVDLPDLLTELQSAVRNVTIPRTNMFNDWHPDFLIDYILNVHHQYLKKTLPETNDMLNGFADKHRSKFTYLPALLDKFGKATGRLKQSMEKEESIIFPYIRQISHAHQNKESYAALLVKTLRKSFGDMIQKEEEKISDIIKSIRQLTDHYTPPENACASHIVNFSMLRELDNDITQHLYLEESILFPKAVQIERELLQTPA